MRTGQISSDRHQHVHDSKAIRIRIIILSSQVLRKSPLWHALPICNSLISLRNGDCQSEAFPPACLSALTAAAAVELFKSLKVAQLNDPIFENNLLGVRSDPSKFYLELFCRTLVEAPALLVPLVCYCKTSCAQWQDIQFDGVDAVTRSAEECGLRLEPRQVALVGALFAAVQTGSLASFLEGAGAEDSVFFRVSLQVESVDMVRAMYIKHFASLEVSESGIEECLRIHDLLLSDSAREQIVQDLCASPSSPALSLNILFWHAWARCPALSFADEFLPKGDALNAFFRVLNDSTTDFRGQCRRGFSGLSLIAKFFYVPESLPLSVYNTIVRKMGGASEFWREIEESVYLVGNADGSEERGPPYYLRWHSRSLPPNRKEEVRAALADSVRPCSNFADLCARVDGGVSVELVRFNLAAFLAIPLQKTDPFWNAFIGFEDSDKQQFLRQVIYIGLVIRAWFRACGFRKSELVLLVAEEEREKFSKVWTEIDNRARRPAMQKRPVFGPIPKSIDVAWVPRGGGSGLRLCEVNQESAIATVQHFNGLIQHLGLSELKPFVRSDLVRVVPGAGFDSLEIVTQGDRFEGIVTELGLHIGRKLARDAAPDGALGSLVIVSGGRYDLEKLLVRYSLLATVTGLLAATEKMEFFDAITKGLSSAVSAAAQSKRGMISNSIGSLGFSFLGGGSSSGGAPAATVLSAQHLRTGAIVFDLFLGIYGVHRCDDLEILARSFQRERTNLAHSEQAQSELEWLLNRYYEKLDADAAASESVAHVLQSIKTTIETLQGGTSVDVPRSKKSDVFIATMADENSAGEFREPAYVGNPSPVSARGTRDDSSSSSAQSPSPMGGPQESSVEALLCKKHTDGCVERMCGENKHQQEPTFFLQHGTGTDGSYVVGGLGGGEADVLDHPLYELPGGRFRSPTPLIDVGKMICWETVSKNCMAVKLNPGLGRILVYRKDDKDRGRDIPLKLCDSKTVLSPNDKTHRIFATTDDVFAYLDSPALGHSPILKTSEGFYLVKSPLTGDWVPLLGDESSPSLAATLYSHRLYGLVYDESVLHVLHLVVFAALIHANVGPGDDHTRDLAGEELSRHRARLDRIHELFRILVQKQDADSLQEDQADHDAAEATVRRYRELERKYARAVDRGIKYLLTPRDGTAGPAPTAHEVLLTSLGKIVSQQEAEDAGAMVAVDAHATPASEQQNSSSQSEEERGLESGLEGAVPSVEDQRSALVAQSQLPASAPVGGRLQNRSKPVSPLVDSGNNRTVILSPAGCMLADLMAQVCSKSTELPARTLATAFQRVLTNEKGAQLSRGQDITSANYAARGQRKLKKAATESSYQPNLMPYTPLELPSRSPSQGPTPVEDPGDDDPSLSPNAKRRRIDDGVVPGVVANGGAAASSVGEASNARARGAASFSSAQDAGAGGEHPSSSAVVSDESEGAGHGPSQELDDALPAFSLPLIASRTKYVDTDLDRCGGRSTTLFPSHLFGYGRPVNSPHVVLDTSDGDKPWYYVSCAGNKTSTTSPAISISAGKIIGFFIAKDAIANLLAVTEEQEGEGKMLTVRSELLFWIRDIRCSPLSDNAKNWLMKNIAAPSEVSGMVPDELRKQASMAMVMHALIRRCPSNSAAAAKLRSNLIGRFELNELFSHKLERFAERTRGEWGIYIVKRKTEEQLRDLGLTGVSVLDLRGEAGGHGRDWCSSTFLEIVSRFCRCTCVVYVKGLPNLEDQLLKWCAEYTKHWPWRSIYFEGVGVGREGFREWSGDSVSFSSVFNFHFLAHVVVHINLFSPIPD